ncbi:MAG TPA: aromatic ring-hydroxylating dioxygenase subunit alpha [Baekduia sp.]|nr:aromatic ring-hydroxylating dioxygenase subunit alpha [Baekduia sp.]
MATHAANDLAVATDTSTAPPEFFPLNGEYYLTDEWYQRDLEQIFYKQWLFAGHGTTIPEPGDYFVFELGTESIIVARQNDGGVKAFHNLCRHRGTRICPERNREKGHLKKDFVCLYHGWSYKLDGALGNAPKMPEDLDKSKFGLKEAHCDEWNSLIFISLADGEPPATISQRFTEVDISAYDLPNSKVVADMTYEIDANWKLVSENFIECYHCSIVHPELCHVYDPHDSVVGEKLSDRIAAQNELPPAAETYHAFSLDGFLRPGRESLTMSGRPAVKRLLGDPTNPPTKNGALYAFPNFDFGILPDYFLVQSWLPISPTKTVFRNTFSVNKDAVEGEDYNVDELVALMDVTSREDLDITAQQDVVQSRAYEPGPYNPTLEAGVVEWMRSYHHIHRQAEEAARKNGSAA